MNRNLMAALAAAALIIAPLMGQTPVPPAPPVPPAAPVVAPAPVVPDVPPVPPVADIPMIEPLPPLPPMPVVAPVPPMPPMPPIDMGNIAITLQGANVALAMAFDPQDDRAQEQAERAREQADRVREQADRAREREERNRERRDDEYHRGMSYLDRRDYDHAIDSFNRVIESKGDRSDGALYWRAYAQNRLGKSDGALATLGELQKNYPQSRWLEDAKALQVEIKQRSGQPLSATDVSDDDLKLMALQGIMNGDPDRAVPAIDRLLKGSSSPHVKERALFVLAQSRSPQARSLLAQIAKGGGNPDVQLKAIEYLGIHASPENQQLLSEVYKSSNDVAVKRAILRSFMISHNRDALLQAARSESNPELRLDAIRQLGVMGGAPELYSSESTYDGKRAILQGLMQSGEAQKLLDIAKSEKDPKLREEAINLLGVMGRSKTGDGLTGMYRQESDANVKNSIINALFIQGNAPALVTIARSESNPALKKEAVSRLSMMHSKEATDYLMELLK